MQKLKCLRRISALLLPGIFALSCARAGEPKAPAARSKHAETLRPKAVCSSIEGKSIAPAKIGLPTGGAKIASATLKPGTGPDVSPFDAVPEYCEVNGEIAPVDPNAPAIHFQVNVPTVWNGGAWQFGADGSDGYIPRMVVIRRGSAQAPLGNAYPPDLKFLITQGYATFGGDAGHNAGPGAGEGPGAGAGQTTYDLPPAPAVGGRGGRGRGRGDGEGGGGASDDWVMNPEAFKNYAYEHIKKTHDVAMEIMVQLYGTKARNTYFAGESNGGKAALQAVGHYPDDYDGVLALVPLVYYTALHMRRDQIAAIQHAPTAWIPPAKAAVVRNEVLRQCDALDGLADGVINNYHACDRLFDPTITPNPLAKIRCAGGGDTGNDCLSDAQIATIDTFHSPMKVGFPLSNGDSDFPGYPAGAEGPTMWLSTPAPPRAYTPQSGGYMGQLVPDWNPAMLGSADVSNDIRNRIQAFSKLVDVPVDWSGFFAHKGKLIIYSGGADYQSNVRAQMRLYDNLVQRQGEAVVNKTIRFYVSPNVGHGSIGINAITGERLPVHVDLVSVLENWVERDVTPPDPLIQMTKELQPPFTITQSKPLCRYPKYPRYNGSGDPKKAESYTCTAP